MWTPACGLAGVKMKTKVLSTVICQLSTKNKIC